MTRDEAYLAYSRGLITYSELCARINEDED